MTQAAVPVENIVWIKKGEGIRASGMIPQAAEFFQDHFPAFPVLPGVLALDILKQTAEMYLREELGQAARFSLLSVRNVRFSAYLKPGSRWESELKLISGEARDVTEWTARLFYEDRPAVSARLVMKKNPA